MHTVYPDILLPHVISTVMRDRRGYFLAKDLRDTSIPVSIFNISNNPPDGWNVTEDEWERGISLCLQARVKGRWYGDILHPTLMTEKMNEYIDKWEFER